MSESEYIRGSLSEYDVGQDRFSPEKLGSPFSRVFLQISLVLWSCGAAQPHTTMCTLAVFFRGHFPAVQVCTRVMKDKKV